LPKTSDSEPLYDMEELDKIIMGDY
jgi:hypothetical protein